MGYSRQGNPWTNNAAPAVNAAALTNIENFLVSMFQVGNISRIGTLTSGTGTQTVSHGLGVAPDFVFMAYAGNYSSSPPGNPLYWYNGTSSQVTIGGQGTFTWFAVAVKF